MLRHRRLKCSRNHDVGTPACDRPKLARELQHARLQLYGGGRHRLFFATYLDKFIDYTTAVVRCWTLIARTFTLCPPYNGRLAIILSPPHYFPGPHIIIAAPPRTTTRQMQTISTMALHEHTRHQQRLSADNRPFQIKALQRCR